MPLPSGLSSQPCSKWQVCGPVAKSSSYSSWTLQGRATAAGLQPARHRQRSGAGGLRQQCWVQGCSHHRLPQEEGPPSMRACGSARHAVAVRLGHKQVPGCLANNCWPSSKGGGAATVKLQQQQQHWLPACAAAAVAALPEPPTLALPSQLPQSQAEPSSSVASCMGAAGCPAAVAGVSAFASWLGRKCTQRVGQQMPRRVPRMVAGVGRDNTTHQHEQCVHEW